MRRSSVIAVASLLVVAAVSLVGCTNWFEDPAKPANTAISVANVHLKKAAVLETEIQSNATTLASLPATKAGAKRALATTAVLTQKLAAEKVELQAAKTSMDSIAKLDVATKFKKYATLESAAISTHLTLIDSSTRLYAATDQLYTILKSKKASVDPSPILKVIAQVKSEITTLSDQATTEAKTASDRSEERR